MSTGDRIDGTAAGGSPPRRRRGAEVDRALADLVAAHGDAVYRLARSIVHDPSLADDVVQETMVKAWRALPDFDGEVPRPWLLKVARNTAISLLRTRREQVREAGEFGDMAATGGGPDTTAVDRAAVDQMWVALAQLDETSRSMVVMRELSGLSYEEIAEVLDLPLATVKTRLFRARRALQHAMKEWRA
ncbi:MAG: RNA polymerase sigma factor [Acidimicrobiales bacterium]|nr:RNA polymerase sigma factor [Acidimicrobiales bacterium]